MFLIVATRRCSVRMFYGVVSWVFGQQPCPHSSVLAHASPLQVISTWCLRAVLHYVHIHGNIQASASMLDPIASGRGIRFRDRQVRVSTLRVPVTAFLPIQPPTSLFMKLLHCVRKNGAFKPRVMKRLGFPAFYTSHIHLPISIPCTPLLAAPRFLIVSLSLAISANPLHTPDPR